MIFKSKLFEIEFILLNHSWNLQRPFNRTALFWAVHQENAEIVQLLIEQKGINIHSKPICA